jgi:threonylcarbamoyladenosine tRNA methylthiotransferase MtaB
MVGFPGEKEKDFQDSYDLIKELEFSRLHVFPYSVREGTPAADMSNQVHGDIKKERSQILRELNKKLMLKYQKKFIGKKRKIIVEEKRDNKTGLLTGITGNYIRVLVEGEDNLMGKMKNVELIESYDYNNSLGNIIV